MMQTSHSYQRKCLHAHTCRTDIHNLQEVESNKGFITNECNLHAQVNSIQP